MHRSSFIRRIVAWLVAAAVVLLLGAPAAQAGLGVFYSDLGPLRLSIDAVGTLDDSGAVQIQKPAGATVKKAFIFSAGTGFRQYAPVDGDVSVAGTPVTWNPEWTVPSSISSTNVAADVTAIVKPVLDAASPGEVDIPIAEQSTLSQDGEVLAVVFNDPSAGTNTIYLMYGAQSTSGDHFEIGLVNPLKPSARATMSLGISYGYQPVGQYSQIDVNGSRLTTSAGGQDDGTGVDGALITVGGTGDSTDDPSDPQATDLSCDGAPRCDDELYDLKPFVGPSDTKIGVDTLNPSNDDNIFFAALTLSAATAVVGNGIVLSPTGTTSQVGTFHFLTAQAQDANGRPAVARTVKLKVTGGPNAGTVLTGVTDASGKARFNYASSATGTDTLEASFVDADGLTQTSNAATMTWAPKVVGTFGGQWPHAARTPLQLYYTYGGGHRYLGNVVAGARNWNAAGTRVRIDAWPGVPYLVHVPFADVSLQDDWWGLTLFADDCTDCGYTRNAIELNRRTLDPEGDEQRTKVATHELGHALGLMHTKGLASDSTPSVMWQGELSSTVKSTPQAFDTSRVKAMYP